MSETGGNAANAQSGSRSLADVHDLRLTALLSDLVEAQGRVNTAKALGVSYGALESRDPTLPSAPVPVAEHPTPSGPAYELVVSLRPDPCDDEKRFGAAAPLVAECRSLREEYGAALDALAKLRAEDELLEMEIVMIGVCGLTLPLADYPSDRFDLEDQTRRRKRRLAVVREEIRRTELRYLLRRICTLGVWRC